MKRLLIKPGSLLLLSMVATNALAHPGHLSDQTVHGFLHIEHIIPLIAIVAVGYAIILIRNK